MSNSKKCAVFVLLGQSNAVGHGIPMTEGDRIIVPMKNVFGLSRSENQSLELEKLRWSGYTSGGMNLAEEQDHTYKSDMNPKYHTRDVARFRCAHHRAVMLLSSATPSFESYYKAKQGVYKLLTLRNRYGGATLPKVTVADMRG